MTTENDATTGTTDTSAQNPAETEPTSQPAAPRRRRAATRPAGPPQSETAGPAGDDAPAPVKRTARKRAAKKTAEPASAETAGSAETAETPAEVGEQPERTPRKRSARKRAAASAAPASTADAETDQARTAPQPVGTPVPDAPESVAGVPATEPAAGDADEQEPDADVADQTGPAAETAPTPEAQPESEETAVTAAATTAVVFQAPEPQPAAPRRRRAATRPAGPPQPVEDEDAPEPEPEPEQPGAPSGGPDTEDDDGDEGGEGGEGRRRRRRRGGRGRRRRGGGEPDGETGDPEDQDPEDRDAKAQDNKAQDNKAQDNKAQDNKAQDNKGQDQSDRAAPGEDTGDRETADDAADGAEQGDAEGEESGSSRRRRRRRRRGGGADGDAEGSGDDPPNTVVKVRQPRGGDDVTAVKGSTRLEAKRQRRREGRDSGRRRPVITESEFLARRESVERVMLVREREGRTQIAVLEDGVLVEHYVARKTQTSMIGNVYLGKVQNVLPSMEAAFVDIGKGRNAVLYAGEVNWDAAGLEGQPKRIEAALKSGDPVLVQVTKDPVGHKGARLTSQISLPGRYLVYVPRSSMTGISRKLPDTERNRLKKILKAVLPEGAGVIVRTAAEGASEDELARDVARLKTQWEDIEKRSSAVNPPSVLYGEPDLAIKVVRDVFNEDFAKLVVSGDEAWETVHGYVSWVAPDLGERLERWDGEQDVFAAHRVDEQIAKALERKVWLPSGGSLVIDRTEAMTVVDVNTGKFTGSGGNLEETVTRNNLEAAEEIVRQLRLRDIGGIVVIDFIDMVLESNRDLVLRRLLECLGRDRTKHQVAEVTSLGLVQMTRKRVGQGLLEAFSEPCEHCGGRGVVLHDEPLDTAGGSATSTGAAGGQKRRGGARDVAAATARATRADQPAPEPSASEQPQSADADGAGPAADRQEEAAPHPV